MSLVPFEQSNAQFILLLFFFWGGGGGVGLKRNAFEVRSKICVLAK